MITVETHGATIPALGFGTWQLRGRTARAVVETALEIGYRHLDTAQMYDNEAEVGAALAASSVARSDVWLTSKVWPEEFRADDLLRAAEERARLLGTPPDLLLLHWPSRTIPLEETIPALGTVVERGLARFAGVSNFTTAQIEEAVRLAPVPLVCDQVEYHPFLRQRAVLATLRKHGMALTAYTPLARGRVLRGPVLERIGRAHGKTAIQVTLRWLVQQPGVCAIPRTSKPENAARNFDIFDFALDEEEMQAIHGLAAPDGRIADYPNLSPDWD